MTEWAPWNWIKVQCKPKRSTLSFSKDTHEHKGYFHFFPFLPMTNPSKPQPSSSLTQITPCSAINSWNDHYTLKHFQTKNTEVEFARAQPYIPTFNSKNTWKSLNWKFPPNTINLRKAQNFSQTSFYKEVS